MRRRLFNLLTAVSLLLCISVVTLWVRSYWRYDKIGVRLPELLCGAESYRGRLLWVWTPAAAGSATEGEDRERTVAHASEAAPGDMDVVWEDLRRSAMWNVAGLSYTVVRASEPPARLLVTPMWLVTLVLAAVPVSRLTYARRGNRGQRRGL